MKMLKKHRRDLDADGEDMKMKMTAMIRERGEANLLPNGLKKMLG